MRIAFQLSFDSKRGLAHPYDRSSQYKPVLLQRSNHDLNDARIITSDKSDGMPSNGFDEWQEIACGSFHTVGITPTGELYSWGGCNNAGTLGHGNEDHLDKPKLIDKSLFSKKAQHAACGSDHTVVLTTEGEVYTW